MTPLDPLRGTPAWGAGDGRCGTPAGYTAHRRRHEPTCRACKDAQAAWQYRYEARRYLAGGSVMLNGVGVHRRIHALARIGWSYPMLAARLGLVGSAVHQFTRSATVTPATYARVAALYDELWDKPGPSNWVRAYAERQGWPPPLAWDDDSIDDPKARPNLGLGDNRRKPIDEIAVGRAMRGDAVALTPDERTEAVRRLKAQGFSLRETSERLHIAKRSVERIKRKAS